MTSGYDIATVTSLGTGVAKTRINGDNNIQKPSQAQTLISVVPYFVSTGAYTAGETMLIEAAVESESVPLVPKRMICPPILGGLGTFGFAQVPILEEYVFNTPLQSGSTQTFDIYGQAQVANTVAPVMGMALKYSDQGGFGPEKFYKKPDNETSTGTAATTVAGNTIQINGGSMITDLYAAVVSGTVTASESYIGDMEFSSDDFDNPFPLKVPVQPVATALGTTIGVGIPKLAHYANVNMPMKNSTNISTTYRQSEALTAAGNFIGGVAYIKNQGQRRR